MRDWNQLWSSSEAFSLGSLVTTLGCASTDVSIVASETGGGLRLTKNPSGNGSEQSGIPSGTSGRSPQMLC